MSSAHNRTHRHPHYWITNYEGKACFWWPTKRRRVVNSPASVSLWPCAGEGCSRSHAAADVAGEGRARGEGDWADSCSICRYVSQVRSMSERRHEAWMKCATNDFFTLQQTKGQQRPKLYNYLCQWTQRRTRTLQVALTYFLTRWFSSSIISSTTGMCIIYLEMRQRQDAL